MVVRRRNKLPFQDFVPASMVVLGAEELLVEYIVMGDGAQILADLNGIWAEM